MGQGSVPGEFSLGGAGRTQVQNPWDVISSRRGLYQIICFDGLQTIFSLAEPSVESEVLCRFIKGKPTNKAAWLNSKNNAKSNNRWPLGAEAGAHRFTRADC